MTKHATAVSVDLGIEEQARHETAGSLIKTLADSYALYLKTQSFHWNVTGVMFQPLHQVFEEQYKELAEAVDLIAERVRALGFPAPASFSEFSRLSSIREENDVPEAQEMISQLVEGHETVVRSSRTACAAAEKAKDFASVDLLTKRIEQHEKTAWMLRSFLS